MWPAKWLWRPSAPKWTSWVTWRARPRREALLRTATEDANRVVYLKAQTDADCIGMGTTLVGLILQEATLWVVNVGDSRAYRITKGGSGASPGTTQWWRTWWRGGT